MNLSQVDLIAQAVEALTSINDRLAHQLVDEFIDPYWASVKVCDSPVEIEFLPPEPHGIFDEVVVKPLHSGGGYQAIDPKHPGFHSMAADLWDLREGK